MLTIQQLKAARALLGWTQQDLARAAGMHLNVINNLERGTTNPRQKTVEKLQKALEDSGVAFLGARGVELARQAMALRKVEGPGCIAALIEDVLRHAGGAGDEILSVMGDIRNFNAHDADAARAFYDEKAARGFRERLITCARPGFYPRHSQDYRVLAPAALGAVDTVIYGDSVAFIAWHDQEVVILRGADFAQGQRRVFEMLWAAGHSPVRAA